MAVIFLDGWDKYGGVNSNPTSVVALLGAEWSVVGTNVTIVNGLSATGYAISVGISGTTAKTLPTSYSRLIGGVRFSSPLGGNAGIIQFQDGASAQCTIVVAVTTGIITLRNGTVTGTVIATGPAVVANSTHYIEWDITFGNAGAYQVWLDGVSIFSGTGDTTTTANNTANGIAFLGTTGSYTVDDLYLFDTTGSTNNAVLLTSPRIETTFPVADSAVQFAPGAGVLGTSVIKSAAINAPGLNSLALRRYTPAIAGTLNSISVQPGVSNAATQLRPVIYADSSGVAGTLLSTGPTVVGTVSGVVVTMPLTTPQTLVAGTQYWLGFMIDLSTITFYNSDVNTQGYRATVTFASGAPGTAPAMTSGTASWAVWGNLTGMAVNYDEVNNNPSEGQYSYVYDSTVGHEDLYTFNAFSQPPVTIHTVAVKAYAQKSDSGTRTVSAHLKSGAVDSAGPSVALGTTFGWLSGYFPTDPNTGSAWGAAALNAATSGLKIDS